MINVTLQFRKDFKSAKLLTKTSFFLYFSNRPKSDEGIKGDNESICTRLAKHVSKYVAKSELIWIDYEQLMMDYFDCIFLSTDDLAHLIPVFSLVPWFLCFLQQLLHKFEEHET